MWKFPKAWVRLWTVRQIKWVVEFQPANIKRLIRKAIAFNEIQKPKHESLIQKSIEIAKILASQYPDVTLAELAVEIAVRREVLFLESIV